MVREDLIGKEIRHKRHGRSIIQGFHVSPRDNHLYIELLFDDTEVRSYDFSEGTLSEKDFEIDKSVSNAFGAVFVKGKFGELLEISDFQDSTYSCSRCKKAVVYPKELQFNDLRTGRKRPKICKECEKRSRDKELNMYRQLMKHYTKKDAKWKYIHDTSGMHVD